MSETTGQNPTEAHGTHDTATAGTPTTSTSATTTLLAIAVIGVGVSVALGVYGRLHEPTGVAINVAGFSGPAAAKAWLTTGAAALGLVQLVSALAMYGRLRIGGGSIPWGPVHRWSGRAAFLLTLPVAIHCLYALGFQAYDTRVLVHSLLGCAFYGAITVKLLGLSRPGMPGWFLPVLGGTALTLLTGLWLTSSLWFFTTVGVSF